MSAISGCGVDLSEVRSTLYLSRQAAAEQHDNIWTDK
jgi:hypothetical protein